MELKTGGVYLIKRKPLKAVDLFDCTNGHYKKLYNLTMTCKVLSLQAGIESRKEKHLVCFLSGGGKEAYGLGSVDYLYTQWLERIELKKMLRDMTDWPENARRHFLMVKGASSYDALEGSLEDARRSIARNDRANRLYNERKKQEKEKKASWKDAHMTAGSFYIESSSNTTGGGSYYAPEATVKVAPVKINGEWVEAPGLPEEEYIEEYESQPQVPYPDDELLEIHIEKPKKKKRKKKKKKAPKKSEMVYKTDMLGKVYTAPPVTVTHHSDSPTLSKETIAKVKKEMDEQAKADKEEMLAKLYGGPGYGEFKKNKGHKQIKKPKKKVKPSLAEIIKKDMTFKQWAEEAEAKIKADKEEAE